MCENCERLIGKIAMLREALQEADRKLWSEFEVGPYEPCDALAATDAELDAWLRERDQRVRREALEEAARIAEAMQDARRLAESEDEPWSDDSGFVAVANQISRTWSEVCATGIRARAAAPEAAP